MHPWQPCAPSWPCSRCHHFRNPAHGMVAVARPLRRFAGDCVRGTELANWRVAGVMFGRSNTCTSSLSEALESCLTCISFPACDIGAITTESRRIGKGSRRAGRQNQDWWPMAAVGWEIGSKGEVALQHAAAMVVKKARKALGAA